MGVDLPGYNRYEMKSENYIMPIYGVRVTFAYGKDIEAISKELNIYRSGYNYDGIQARMERVKESDGHTRFFLLVKKGKEGISLPNVVHEIGHLCIAICEYVGIKADWENDEPLAYMMEATMEQILNFFKSGPYIKIK